MYDTDFHLPVGEQKAPLKQGWHRPQNAAKWHYYASDGRSLCGKWMLFGGRIMAENQSLNRSDDDCKACARRWELLRED